MMKKNGWRVGGWCDGVYELLELVLETISKSYCAKSVRDMNVGRQWNGVATHESDQDVVRK